MNQFIGYFFSLLHFFFFSCGHICGIWKFPGQGLNLSHSFDLRHRFGHTISFNSPGSNPCLHSFSAPICSSGILNPPCHSRNSSPCWILHVAILYLKTRVYIFFLSSKISYWLFFVTLRNQALWLKHWKNWDKHTLLKLEPKC